MSPVQPEPHPPWWAVIDGMPEPRPGEPFVAYWTRIGFDQAEVRASLDGLTDRTADVANLRMARLVGERVPGAKARAASRLIRREPIATQARAKAPDAL